MAEVPCPQIIMGRYPTIKHFVTVLGFHCLITSFFRLCLRRPLRRHRLYSLRHPRLPLLTLLRRRRTERLGLLVRTRARLLQRRLLHRGRRLLLHHHHAMAVPEVAPEPQARPGLYGCGWGILQRVLAAVGAGVALSLSCIAVPGQRSEPQGHRSHSKQHECE